MKKLPFGHTPDTELFCPTSSHLEALNVLLFSIKSGESFCKITGEVGSGKTMLCRVLLKNLEQTNKIAYIPNPNLSVLSLYYALAKELGLKVKNDSRDDQVLSSIQNKLIKINLKKGPVILVIDEAQVMSDETIEALRLFTNLETEHQKLLQIVLFGQPELDDKLTKQHLRQINQRISFSYQLKPLSIDEVKNYTNYRLHKVCLSEAIKIDFIDAFLINYFSKGVPRVINTLCHKSLLLGYSSNKRKFSRVNLIRAALDTPYVDRFILKHFKLIVSIVLISISSSAFAYLGAS